MTNHETSGVTVDYAYLRTLIDSVQAKLDEHPEYDTYHYTREQMNTIVEAMNEIVDEYKGRDSEIARLRAELATMHKVVIDALAILIASTREADIQEAISILETVPGPSDEVLKIIEANEDEQA